MARTKGTRRLAPLSFYEAQKRSPQEVEAGRPPTHRQFQLAVDYRDEETIIAFLTLTPNIQLAMDATNAYVLRNKAMPRIRRIDDRPDVFATVTTGEAEESAHQWIWPYAPNRLMRQATLFTTAAQLGFADVVEWFFGGSHDRVTRLGATLALTLPSMLANAVQYNRVMIVETLLESTVFGEMLSTKKQQRILDAALVVAQDTSMCHMLIAHGASVSQPLSPNLDESQRPVVWGTSTGAYALGTNDRRLLGDTIRRGDREAVVQSIRHTVVVDASALLAAVHSVDPWAVDRVLSDGFADVDACTRSSRTPLMEFAIWWGPWTVRKTRERHHDVARVLLKHGADVTRRDPQGRTALHLAIEQGHLPCVEALLDHAVTTNGIDSVHSDRLALEIACQALRPYSESEHVLAALLTSGACPHLFDELWPSDLDELSAAMVDSALAKCRPCQVCSTRIAGETVEE